MENNGFDVSCAINEALDIYEQFFIEINDLEDMNKIIEITGHPIILEKDWMYKSMHAIEIYDNWIE